MMESIIIGSDHAGFQLKKIIKDFLEKQGIPVTDAGCDAENSCDYPVFARKLCEGIKDGGFTRGILVCGTGLGMSMAANRFPWIRAALCTTEFHARMSRAHNDANVLVLGSRVTGTDLALSILKAWLDTPFEGGRHQRRIDFLQQVD